MLNFGRSFCFVFLTNGRDKTMYTLTRLAHNIRKRADTQNRKKMLKKNTPADLPRMCFIYYLNMDRRRQERERKTLFFVKTKANMEEKVMFKKKEKHFHAHTTNGIYIYNTIAHIVIRFS